MGRSGRMWRASRRRVVVFEGDGLACTRRRTAPKRRFRDRGGREAVWIGRERLSRLVRSFVTLTQDNAFRRSVSGIVEERRQLWSLGARISGERKSWTSARSASYRWKGDFDARTDCGPSATTDRFRPPHGADGRLGLPPPGVAVIDRAGASQRDGTPSDQRVTRTIAIWSRSASATPPNTKNSTSVRALS